MKTVVAQSVAESFVAELTPSAGTPETRLPTPPKLPELPDIQSPKLDVVLTEQSLGWNTFS
jgi:hypothetical protein